jgi:hypothetical protein
MDRDDAVLTTELLRAHTFSGRTPKIIRRL